MDNLIYVLAVNAIPLLFAITLHEAAHGYAARMFGDRTAEMLGRISLNPIRHVDLLGTIVVPALTLLLGGFIFGWAKPVPINSNNLRNPKTDMIWVAAAGPLSNFLMAVGWVLLLRFAPSEAVAAIAKAGVAWNVALMVLNLLPILPLDGGHIVFAVAEKVKGSAFSAVTYGRASFVGFALVMVIFAIALQNDIGRLAGDGFQVNP